MDINKYKCISKECPNQAVFQCSCSEKILLCRKHLSEHDGSEFCNFSNIQGQVRLYRIKLVKDAFNNLSFRMIKKAEDLFKEINIVLTTNITFLEEMRIKINSLDVGESLEKMFYWAEQYNFKLRSLDEFNSNIRYLLSINGDSEEVEANRLDVKKKYKEALENIEVLLKEKSNLEKNSQILSETIKKQEICFADKKVLEERLKKAAENINELESKLNEKKEFDEELQKVSETNEEIKKALQEIAERKIKRISKEFFESMTMDQKLEYLIEQGYQNCKELFVESKNKPSKITLTNDRQYIFVCKS